MEIKWRPGDDESEDSASLLPLKIGYFSSGLQGSAGLLVIGNILPTLGMLLFRWDAYQILLFFLCEAMLLMLRDYFLVFWYASSPNVIITIFKGCLLFLPYGPMLLVLLVFGFPVLVDMHGPEQLHDHIAALQRVRDARLINPEILALFREQVSALWAPIVVLLSHQVFTFASARARAVRMGRPFRPRPYPLARWVFLLMFLFGGIAFLDKFDSVYVGIFLYLAAKCWGDLSDFVLDCLYLEIGDTGAEAGGAHAPEDAEEPE